MNRIILASSSPRRRELLKKYYIEPQIVPSYIKEKVNKGETPEQIAMSLAYEKAYDVLKKFNGNEIIIGADTVVCVDDKILGKPKNKEEAFSMLKILSGRSHYVITGIAVLGVNSSIKIIDYEKTEVYFRSLTDEKINKYIKTEEYKDKAGAYGIQGNGEILVEKIKGCYSNIVGLPIPKLDMLLEKYFNISLL